VDGEDVGCERTGGEREVDLLDFGQDVGEADGGVEIQEFDIY
jgi:hypothetical protein